MEKIIIDLKEIKEFSRMQQVKLQVLKQTLEKLDNNRQHTANYLGVSIRSVRNWIKELKRYEMFKRYSN